MNAHQRRKDRRKHLAVERKEKLKQESKKENKDGRTSK